MALALGLILLALATLSLALPGMKCGWYWPQWFEPPGADCARWGV